MSQNIWDFWAGRYEKLWVQKYSLKPTRDLVIMELKKHIKLNQKQKCLLDVGCGTGQLLLDIQEQLGYLNITLTGIDSSAKMIAVAQKKLIKAKLQISNALDLPFSANQFDLLTCCHSFPYYKDKLKALKEFKRVVKPGGFLFLIQASENSIYDKLVMQLVKLTTSPADYPSKVHIKEMVGKTGFILLEQKRLESKFFMPSIILSILQNGDKNENFIS